MVERVVVLPGLPPSSRGQRQGVIRNLIWAQVELDTKRPVIRFGPGKGGQYHAVPIQKELLHDLITYHRLTNPAPEDWVLPSRQTAPCSPLLNNGPLEGRTAVR